MRKISYALLSTTRHRTFHTYPAAIQPLPLLNRGGKDLTYLSP